MRSMRWTTRPSPGGRDVQCSNCGHAWFQRPPEIEAEEELDDEIFLIEDEARLAEPAPRRRRRQRPDLGRAPGIPEPSPPSSVAPASSSSGAGAPLRDRRSYDPDELRKTRPHRRSVSEDGPPRKPALDDALMAVLREEAEREAAVRRAEAPKAIETQTEMGLRPAAPVPPSVLAARERFAELSIDREEIVEDDDHEIVTRPASRRELLPDIEEINSTLRASSEPRGDDEDTFLPPPEPLPDGRSGFRSGFLLMVLVAAGLWLAYVMAPRIVAQIPRARRRWAPMSRRSTRRAWAWMPPCNRQADRCVTLSGQDG